jgi:ribosomal protein S18 acetylase RimI-like enzyme
MIIKRLTPALCNEIREQANHCLYGDGTCDISNMDSCFASEVCATGSSPRTKSIDELLSEEQAYVIVKNDSVFCACVVVRSRSDGAFYIHTLCVNPEFRGRRIASKLIKRMQSKECPLYLNVMHGKNTHMSNLFQKRSTGLLSFYGKLGFRVVNKDSLSYLLQWSPDGQ